MSRLLKVVALLLATLWLPATVHCQLEGVGLDSLFACANEAGAAHTDGDTCTDDGCQTIESGQIVITKSRVDLSQPPAALLDTSAVCLFLLAPLAPAPEFFAVHQEKTLPLQRTWQFARRAALPARAPDSLNAARA